MFVNRDDEESAKLIVRGRQVVANRQQINDGGSTSSVDRRREASDAQRLLDRGRAVLDNHRRVTRTMSAPPIPSRDRTPTIAAPQQEHQPLQAAAGLQALVDGLTQENMRLKKQVAFYREQQQLASPNTSLAAAEQNSVSAEILRSQLAEKESEIIAMCGKLNDLQSVVNDRDDQLSKALGSIDRLESELQELIAQAAEDPNVFRRASPSSKKFVSPPSPDQKQLSNYELEEQLHAVMREKVELEDLRDKQQYALGQWQAQWNVLVQEMQNREHALTLELETAKRSLGDYQAAAAGGGGDSLVPRSELEASQAQLYQQFNDHIAQYQKVNEDSWASMTAKHEEEMAALNSTIEQYKIAVAQLQEQAAQISAENQQLLEKEHARGGNDGDESQFMTVAVAQLERDLQQARDDLASMQLASVEKESAQTQQLSEHHSHIEVLQEQLRYLRDENVSLADENQSLKQHVGELQQEKSSVDDMLRRAEDEFQLEREHFNRSLAHAQSSHEHYSSTVAEAQTVLEQDRTALREELATKAYELAILQEANAQLRASQGMPHAADPVAAPATSTGVVNPFSSVPEESGGFSLDDEEEDPFAALGEDRTTKESNHHDAVEGTAFPGEASVLANLREQHQREIAELRARHDEEYLTLQDELNDVRAVLEQSRAATSVSAHHVEEEELKRRVLEEERSAVAMKLTQLTNDFAESLEQERRRHAVELESLEAHVALLLQQQQQQHEEANDQVEPDNHVLLEETIAQQKTLLMQLQQQLVDSQAELDALREDVELSRNDQATSEIRAQALQQQLQSREEAFRDIIAAAELEKDTILKQLLDAKSELQQLQTSSSESINQIAPCDEESMKEKDEELARLKQQVAGLNERLHEHDIDAAASLKEQSRVADELRETIQRLEQFAEMLQSRTSTLESQVEHGIQTLAEKQSQVDALTDDVEIARNDQSTSEMKLEAALLELNGVKQQLEEAIMSSRTNDKNPEADVDRDQQVAALREANIKLREEVSKLDARLQELSEKNIELEDKILDLEVAAQTAKDVLAEETEIEEELKRALRDAEKQAKDATEQVKSLTSSKEASIEQLNRSLHQMGLEVQQAREEREATQRRFEELSAEVERAQAEITARREDEVRLIRSQQASVENARVEEMAALTAALQHVQRLHSDLQVEYGNMERRLGSENERQQAEAELLRLRTDLQDAHNALMGLQAELELERAARTTAEAALVEKDNLLETLATHNNDELSQKIQELSHALSESQMQAEVITTQHQAALTEYQAQCQTAWNTLQSNHDADMEKLRGESASEISDLQRLLEERDALVAETTRTGKKRDEASKTALQGLQDQLRQAHDEVLALQKQLADRQGSLVAKLSEMQQTHAADVEQIHTRYREEMNALHSRLESQPFPAAAATTPSVSVRSVSLVNETPQRSTAEMMLFTGHGGDTTASSSRDNSLSPNTKLLQTQVNDLARQNQVLTQQLRAVTTELEEKQTIIRDQDYSLASYGETDHNTSMAQLQQLAERASDMEVKYRRAAKERDTALAERDSLEAEYSKVQRKLLTKDQSEKRLDTELKTQKTIVSTLRSDVSQRTQTISDLRRDLLEERTKLQSATDAQTEAQELSRQNQQELACQRLQVIALEAVYETANIGFDDKIRISQAFVRDLNRISTAQHHALLERCDQIDQLAEQAMADGDRQLKQATAEAHDLTLQRDAALEACTKLESSLSQQKYECNDLTAQLESARIERMTSARAAHEESYRLQAEMQQVALQLAAKQNQITILQEELRSLEATSQQAADRAAASRAELQQELAAVRDACREKMEAAQQMRASAEESVTQLQNERDVLKRDLAEAHRVAKLATEESASATLRCEQLQQQHDRITYECKELRRSLQTVQRQKETESEAASKKLAEFAEARNLLSTTCDKLRDEIEARTAEKARLLEQLDDAKSAEQSASADVNRYEQRLKESHAAITEHEKKNTGLLKQVRTLEQAVADHQAEVEDTRHALATLQKSSQESLAVERRANEEQKEAAYGMKKKLLASTEKIASLEEELSATSTDSARWKGLAEQAQTDRDRLSETLVSAERMLHDANAQIQLLSSELSTSRSTFMADIVEAKETINAVRLELANAKRTISQNEVKIQLLGDELQRITEAKQLADAEHASLKLSSSETLRDRAEKLEALTVAQRQLFSVKEQLEMRIEELQVISSAREKLQHDHVSLKQLFADSSATFEKVNNEKDVIQRELQQLRDEHRRLKSQSELKISELETALEEREQDLNSAQNKHAAALTQARSTEVSLQQQITDLTLAKQHASNELASLANTRRALESNLESERRQLKKAVEEIALQNRRQEELEEELSRLQTECLQKSTSLTKMANDHDQEVALLKNQFITDRKNATAALERVITADRQALADVRHGREQALRAVEAAQKDTNIAEQTAQELLAENRRLRKEVDERHRVVLDMQATVDQAAMDLGILDGSSLHVSSELSPGGSPHIPLPAFIDTLVSRLNNSRRANETVAAEVTQLNSLTDLLREHEGAANELHSMNQAAGKIIRLAAEEVKRRRPAKSNGVEYQAYRSLRHAAIHLQAQSVNIERVCQNASEIAFHTRSNLDHVREQLTNVQEAIGLCTSGARDGNLIHVLDAVHQQRVVLSSGMTVLSARIGHQARLLQQTREALRRWIQLYEERGRDAALRLETQYITTSSAGGNNTNTSATDQSQGTLVMGTTTSLVPGMKELLAVFAEGSACATNAVASYASPDIIYRNGNGNFHAATAASSSFRVDDGSNHIHQHRGGGGGLAAPHFGSSPDEEDEHDITEDNEDALLASSAASHADGGDEGSSRRGNMAMQKLGRENKRLYNLIRNLTERLRVAQTQAVTSRNASATAPAPPPQQQQQQQQQAAPQVGGPRNHQRDSPSQLALAVPTTSHLSPIRRDEDVFAVDRRDRSSSSASTSSRSGSVPVPVPPTLRRPAPQPAASLREALTDDLDDASPDVRWVSATSLGP